LRRTGRRGVNASAITVLDIKGGLTEEVTRVEIVPVPTVEEILHAVFWQALTGGKAHMPPGTTRELLR